MMVLFKAIFLLVMILFICPLIFFLLVGFFGNYFSLTINKESWLARTEIAWIKNLVHKFLI